jgi:hypothetical protein
MAQIALYYLEGPVISFREKVVRASFNKLLQQTTPALGRGNKNQVRCEKHDSASCSSS